MKPGPKKVVRGHATMRRVSEHTTFFDGATVYPALKVLGCKWQRFPRGPGYLVPTRDAEDLAALLAHRWNVDVQLVTI